LNFLSQFELFDAFLDWVLFDFLHAFGCTVDDSFGFATWF
jgi:hypothetical protein